MENGSFDISIALMGAKVTCITCPALNLFVLCLIFLTKHTIKFVKIRSAYAECLFYPERMVCEAMSHLKGAIPPNSLIRYRRAPDDITPYLNKNEYILF